MDSGNRRTNKQILPPRVQFLRRRTKSYSWYKYVRSRFTCKMYCKHLWPPLTFMEYTWVAGTKKSRDIMFVCHTNIVWYIFDFFVPATQVCLYVFACWLTNRVNMSATVTYQLFLFPQRWGGQRCLQYIVQVKLGRTYLCQCPGSWLSSSVGESTVAPTTRFPIWTRLSRREVRASRRLYVGGRSCLRDSWRAWRIRDCRSAWCTLKWWGARAVWGARKKSKWGVSWTTSELSASTPTSGRLQPRTRGNGAERQNKGRNISWRNGSLRRKPRLDYTGCSGMPERDGKDQGENSPKQAGSCWFAHSCWLATSGANLFPPGVWFADAMTSFSGVTFVLFRFVFVFILSLKPWPFAQLSFDMQLFFFFFCLF